MGRVLFVSMNERTMGWEKKIDREKKGGREGDRGWEGGRGETPRDAMGRMDACERPSVGIGRRPSESLSA